MTELVRTEPFAGLLPLTIGQLRLAASHMGPMTAIAARASGTELSARLQAAHGLGLPEPGRVVENGAARLIWFGMDQYLLTGVAPDAGLAAHAALSDQSDAWAAAELSGSGGALALAHLVPVDLRPEAFPVGQTARTQIQHMHGSVTRLGADRFLLMVFRSMAESFVHDMQRAMEDAQSRC